MGLLLCDLVHQLIDLIQQEQPPPGVLRSGDTSVDATGNLVNIHTDFVHLPTEVLDLLGRPGMNRITLNQPDEERPLGQAALPGLVTEQLVLCRGQFNVQMVHFFFLHQLPSFLRPETAKLPSAGGIGVRGLPLQAAQNVHLRDACGPRRQGRRGPGPAVGGAVSKRQPHLSCPDRDFFSFRL